MYINFHKVVREQQMQYKKLITGVFLVAVLFLVGFTANNQAVKSNDPDTSLVAKNGHHSVNLKNAQQARSFLGDRYGNAGWMSTRSSQDKNNHPYWTFVASHNSDNGLVKAGQTLYIHQDGTVVL